MSCCCWFDAAADNGCGTAEQHVFLSAGDLRRNQSFMPQKNLKQSVSEVLSHPKTLPPTKASAKHSIFIHLITATVFEGCGSPQAPQASQITIHLLLHHTGINPACALYRPPQPDPWLSSPLPGHTALDQGLSAPGLLLLSSTAVAQTDLGMRCSPLSPC